VPVFQLICRFKRLNNSNTRGCCPCTVKGHAGGAARGLLKKWRRTATSSQSRHASRRDARLLRTASASGRRLREPSGLALGPPRQKEPRRALLESGVAPTAEYRTLAGRVRADPFAAAHAVGKPILRLAAAVITDHLLNLSVTPVRIPSGRPVHRTGLIHPPTSGLPLIFELCLSFLHARISQLKKKPPLAGTGAWREAERPGARAAGTVTDHINHIDS
jgi:hypothetical protein